MRHILISATGTGKTYLSAFDVQKFNPKKFLFVVHRKNIAEAALKTFASVLEIQEVWGFILEMKRMLILIFCFLQFKLFVEKKI